MSLPPTRRRFLNNSIGVAAAMSAAGAAFGADAPNAGAAPATTAPAKKPRVKADSLDGANDRINVAIIGCGKRGSNHLDEWLNLGDFANVVALCDPDQKALDAKSRKIDEEIGTQPKCYQDIRKMFDENKEIDAVSIATPNHWHTLAALWAVQAGKDVYVEKPLSHNIFEGRRLVEAARKHNRIVLHGTQCRSIGTMNQAMQFLHDGHLGKIYLARGLCYKRRGSLGLVGSDQKIPETVDYDLWCGPAPMTPLHRKDLHYDWHWFWETGNGDIGNQGVHQMDVCAWGLNKQTLPKRVQCIGGRFGYVDDGQTPNTQIAVLNYDDADVIFEVRGLPSDACPGAKDGVSNIFYGTEGMMVCNGYSNCVAYAPDGSKMTMPAYNTGATNNHFIRFIKAIQTRKLAHNQGEAEAGHVASAMCHMANISYRMGTNAPFNDDTKAFGDDKAAYATLMRLESHLQRNGLELEESDYILGPSLDFDPKAERFTNNNEANKWLSRDYRAPFVVA